ncbi:MAG: peptidylprolyl isomerase [Bryobacteraceae bacterium]|nr:peptidylprolyl isomerase [Bryobacteraceae bacterium]
MTRFCLLTAALAAMVLSGACKKAAPANVAATVNDRPITYAELDKQYRLQFYSQADRPSDDQMLIQKLEVLRILVDNEVMLQRAEKLGLMATDSEVDGKLAEMKAPYTQEEFQKQLDARKMSVDDLKAQLRRDLSIQKLLTKEVSSHVNISDKDVNDFYSANKAAFNFAEPQVHLAQLLVTSSPDPNVRNLKNDKAQNDDQAQKKVRMLANRIQAGEDFGMLAQNYSEDPNTASNGGDLGFVRESDLEQASPELRKLIMSLQPGQASAPIKTQEGYRILKVISKEPAGQRELTDPRVQQNIREQLRNRKEQLLRAAYYEVARNESKVVNYFAQSVVPSLAEKK